MNRNKVIAVGMCATLLLTGCSLEKQHASTTTGESYKAVDLKTDPSDTLYQGEHTVKAGRYQVLNAVVIVDGKSMTFAKHNYLRLDSDTKLTIENGKIVPIKEAYGINYQKYKNGVFYVGNDIPKGKYVISGKKVEIYKDIYTIEHMEPDKVKKNKEIVTLSKGMMVKLTDAVLAPYIDFDIEKSVAEYKKEYQSPNSPRQGSKSKETPEPITQDASENPTGDKEQERVSYDEGTYNNMPSGTYVVYAKTASKKASISTSDYTLDIMSRGYFSISNGDNVTLKNAYAVPVSKIKSYDALADDYIRGGYLVGRDIPAGTYNLSCLDSSNSWYAKIYSDLPPKGSYDQLNSNQTVTLEDGMYFVGNKAILSN